MSVDRLIGGLFLFACLLLWFWIIPQQVVGEEQAFYPRLTVILVAIPAALMFLRNKGRRITLAFFREGSDISKDLAGKILVLVLSYIVFLLCVEKIGFFVSSAVFCPLYMLFFEERKFWRISLTTCGLLGGIYIIVVQLLKYPLPAGLLF